MNCNQRFVAFGVPEMEMPESQRMTGYFMRLQLTLKFESKATSFIAPTTTSTPSTMTSRPHGHQIKASINQVMLDPDRP